MTLVLIARHLFSRKKKDSKKERLEERSMVVYGAAGFLQQMPLRKECPEGLNRDGIAEAPEAALSSGSSIMSGLAGPVG